MVKFVRSTDPATGAYEAITQSLNAATAERKRLVATLEVLEDEVKQAPVVPTVEEITALAVDVEARVHRDPVGAREMLRQMLDKGVLVLHPQADGSYRAESSIFPIMDLKRKRPGVAGPDFDREISAVARGRYARRTMRRPALRFMCLSKRPGR
jgi:hypothetical protein